MGSTLAQILPLAIGASFSPSGLLLVIGILSGSERPRRKALAFVLGSTFFLLLTGTVVLLLSRWTLHMSHPSHRLSGILDIIAATVIVLLVALSLIRGRTRKEHHKKNNVPFGVVGFLFMLLNTSTLILFFAACKIIGEHHFGPLRDTLLLAILIVISMSLVAFPVAVTYAVPSRSQRVLAPVSDFMTRHGKQVANVYFLVMAVYLLVRGVMLL